MTLVTIHGKRFAIDVDRAVARLEAADPREVAEAHREGLAYDRGERDALPPLLARAEAALRVRAVESSK